MLVVDLDQVLEDEATPIGGKIGVVFLSFLEFDACTSFPKDLNSIAKFADTRRTHMTTVVLVYF